MYIYLADCNNNNIVTISVKFLRGLLQRIRVAQKFRKFYKTRARYNIRLSVVWGSVTRTVWVLGIAAL